MARPRGSPTPGRGHLVCETVKLWVARRGTRRQPYLVKGAPKDAWGRFWAGLGVFALVIGGGTFGYHQLGLTVGEALYQTVITVTTVGYGEVGTITDS